MAYQGKRPRKTILNMKPFNAYSSETSMSDKKEIQQPGLDTEEAKDLELDEQPKPTRKVSHPSTPISNKDEPSTHDKRKGRRTIK
jgi:hypothetical protein